MLRGEADAYGVLIEQLRGSQLALHAELREPVAAEPSAVAEHEKAVRFASQFLRQLRDRDGAVGREAGEDAVFDDELIGMGVKNADTGETLGRVTLVEDYPASKVYTVTGEKTYLIPAVPEVFIRSVDLEANVMEVHILKGMASDEN